MFEYIKAEIAELTPTYVVLEANHIGYHIHISLFSFSQLQGKSSCQLFLHQIIREDAHLLFGFTSIEERDIFRKLISVSGIGASTARMIQSSMTPDELISVIANSQVDLLKSVKGIGAKTAERIIVDLKDKIGKSSDNLQLFKSADNTIKKEALSALEILGFPRKLSEKVVEKLLSVNKSLAVEDLIKQALKQL